MGFKFEVKNKIFAILLLWVFSSAFYYAGDFLTGNLGEARSINFYHQLLKYIVAFLVSIAFFYVNRTWGLLFIYFILLVFFCVALVLIFSGYWVGPMLDTLVVLTSFVGLSFAASVFDRRMVGKLSLVIVFSAFIVSIISFFEYFFMMEILGDYWRNTGGYRSISTLLNPNNLGTYLGAALIINVMVFESGRLMKAIVAAPIFTALLMSGSRTAIFSFLTAMLMVILFMGGMTYRVRNIIACMLLVFLSLVSVATVLWSNLIELPERATDMYTAILRIEKYLEYLLSVDLTYLWPDYYGVRTEMVSESTYFHFSNSFGLIFGLLLILLLFAFNLFKLRDFKFQSPNFIFGILVFYYLFAMLFENVLMSFPNNQLFFIALGLAWSSKLNSNQKSKNE